MQKGARDPPAFRLGEIWRAKVSFLVCYSLFLNVHMVERESEKIEISNVWLGKRTMVNYGTKMSERDIFQVLGFSARIGLLP